MHQTHGAAFGRSQTYTDYPQEAWKAGAGSHGPISLQMSMHAPEVPFAWNVNRMEASSLMAGAGALGLAFV